MYKIEELITIHNNLARRKGLRQIPVGKKLTLKQITDRIEAINKQQPVTKWNRYFTYWRIK